MTRWGRRICGISGTVAACAMAVACGLPLAWPGVAAAASATSKTSPVNSATAQSPFPVRYSVIAAGPEVLTNPSGAPAGANNWSCKPSPVHPDPIVLVHGLGATMAENWATFSPLLADNGYCVFALTYGLDPGEVYVGGLQAMETSSQQLATFVDRVLSRTGATKVDLVGHSEGTVMPQYYLKFLGGEAKVNRYVAITPLYQGTTLDGVGAFLNALETYFPTGAAPIEAAVASGCGSCQEFLQGSPFLQHLYADGHFAVPGIEYTTIMTRYDELVSPYTSGELHAPNATNIVVQDQCPLDFSEHATMAFDPVVAQDVLNALDPRHSQPVPCTLVLPGIGAPAFR